MLCYAIGETEYTRDYSWSAYCKVKRGMSRADLISILGLPFWVQRGWEIWSYDDLDGKEVRFVFGLGDDVDKITLACSRVETRPLSSERDNQNPQLHDVNQEPRWKTQQEGELTEYRGATGDEILARFGEPQDVRKGLQDSEVWHYSRSPSHTHYIVRGVLMDPQTDRVKGPWSYAHWD